jgi:hypothetical protein
LPPTFDIKNRRANAKTNCSNFFHGDLGMVENNVFAFNFLLLMSKIGDEKTKKLP